MWNASGLSALNLYYCRASPGVATQHAKVRALRAWDFDAKVRARTAR